MVNEHRCVILEEKKGNWSKQIPCAVKKIDRSLKEEAKLISEIKSVEMEDSEEVTFKQMSESLGGKGGDVRSIKNIEACTCLEVQSSNEIRKEITC